MQSSPLVKLFLRNSLRFSPEKSSAFAFPTGWNIISKKHSTSQAVPTHTLQSTQLPPHAIRVPLPLHNSFESRLVLRQTQQWSPFTPRFYSSVNSYQHRPQLFLVYNTPSKVQIRERWWQSLFKMFPSVLSALEGSLNIHKRLAWDQFSSGFYFTFIVNAMLSCFLNTTSVSVIACISKYCSTAI